MLIKKIKILNYKISIITLKLFKDKLKQILKLKRKSYICVSAVHGAVESFYNNKYKIAHDKADIAVPDGRPIYWALKLLGNSKVDHLPGYFVTNEICKLANKKVIKLVIYGSTEDVQTRFY